MALSRSSYGQVGTCRAYFDIVQYAKAIGYIKELKNWQNSPVIDSESSPFDYNPAKVETYAVDGTYDYLSFVCYFKSRYVGDRNFAQLLQSINYYGIFGHNIQTASNTYEKTALGCQGSVTGEGNVFANPTAYTEIVGDRTDVGNGYTIVGIDDWNTSEPKNFEALDVQIKAGTNQTFTEGDSFNIGAISVGKYMDFPNSPDLSLDINYTYDGISSKNTLSGRTITSTNFYRPPDWGDYPRWTHVSLDSISNAGLTDSDWVQEMDMRTVGANGRRGWSLKWSFVDKVNMFSKTSEGNMFAFGMENILDMSTTDTLKLGLAKDNIIGTMMTLTLGGQIPFLFQPDNTKRDFAFVKINQKSISVKQVAHGTYDISLKLTEVW